MAEMTEVQFEVIAEMLRSRDPAKAAARMVLLDGHSPSAAAARLGIKSAQAVSNAVRRYRNAHRKLREAYANA